MSPLYYPFLYLVGQWQQQLGPDGQVLLIAQPCGVEGHIAIVAPPFASANIIIIAFSQTWPELSVLIPMHRKVEHSGTTSVNS